MRGLLYISVFIGLAIASVNGCQKEIPDISRRRVELIGPFGRQVWHSRGPVKGVQVSSFQQTEEWYFTDSETGQVVLIRPGIASLVVTPE